MTNKFIYLAAPYSHHNAAIRQLRFDMINEYAARVMAEGFAVFSPISQSHPVAAYLPEDKILDHDFWMMMDLPVLECASLVLVLRLDGWDKSRGVAREVRHARLHNKTVLSTSFDAPIPLDLITMAMPIGVAA